MEKCLRLSVYILPASGYLNAYSHLAWCGHYGHIKSSFIPICALNSLNSFISVYCVWESTGHGIVMILLRSLLWNLQ